MRFRGGEFSTRTTGNFQPELTLYRVCCPECGVRVEKVPQLPSKAPFSKDFEDAVGLACESASVRRGPGSSDWPPARCERSTCGICSAGVRRRKDRLEQMGVDEIYFGKQMKFITVVSNLETGEPLSL